MKRCILNLVGTSLALSSMELPCHAEPVEEDMLPRHCQHAGSRHARRYFGSLPACDEVGPGELCEGSGECGTSNRLNNCGKFDLYHRMEWEDDYEDDDEELSRDVGEHDEEETDQENDGEVEEQEEDVPTEEVNAGEEGEVQGDGEGSVESENPGQTSGGGGSTTTTVSSFNFPAYSQQCRDDAGPVIGDDEEVYGPGQKYHSASKAAAVLKEGGECADPLKAACASRAGGGPITADIARAAYLEGPVQCGGKGWFCRILPDPAHSGGDQSDWNFNHCNRTEYGDSDGHCHGSDYDDVFYWWVRDHWHRNYAGRLHCCCDWGLTAGVVARCDYRAHLEPGENSQCRDANEDHTGPGSGFSLGFEQGCPNLGTQLPLPEPNEAQCWDVLNFAPGSGN